MYFQLSLDLYPIQGHLPIDLAFGVYHQIRNHELPLRVDGQTGNRNPQHDPSL